MEALPGVIVFGGADPLPRPRDLLRALRHADVSVVVDLSHTSHGARLDYVRNLLPAIATLRRHTGLPHRIVVDEAHYFLQDDDSQDLLDLELASYILVSYRASKLHSTILASAEGILVTRESDPGEIRALRRLCGSCQGEMSEGDWIQMFGNLAIGEAVALPLTSDGDVRRIRLAPHVRHMAKYIDIPVSENDQFVFWRDGVVSGERARTLHQLVSVLERWPAPAIDSHLKRNDISRWIANIFGDYPLAKTVQKLENNYRLKQSSDVLHHLVEAIRTRYDFVETRGPHPTSHSTVPHDDAPHHLCAKKSHGLETRVACDVGSRSS